MIMIDTEYLASIPKAHPTPVEVRWGCSFDGRQLALVGFILEPNGNYIPMSKNSNQLIPETDAVVFYASTLPGCTISRAVNVFDELRSVLGGCEMKLYFEGALGRTEVFIRHLRRHTSHKVRLFRDGQGKWFDPVEVMASVADDQEMGRIKMSPSFEERPERVLLDESTAVIEERVMSPLQSAFVYGLGYWACRERRKKFTTGVGKDFLTW